MEATLNFSALHFSFRTGKVDGNILRNCSSSRNFWGGPCLWRTVSDSISGASALDVGSWSQKSGLALLGGTPRSEPLAHHWSMVIKSSKSMLKFVRRSLITVYMRRSPLKHLSLGRMAVFPRTTEPFKVWSGCYIVLIVVFGILQSKQMVSSSMTDANRQMPTDIYHLPRFEGQETKHLESGQSAPSQSVIVVC